MIAVCSTRSANVLIVPLVSMVALLDVTLRAAWVYPFSPRRASSCSDLAMP